MRLLQQIKGGKYSIFVTTMEQLGQNDGHMTKFTLLLRNKEKKFVNGIRTIHIDEIQMIETAGIAKHGQPAFRPLYGRFDTFWLLFPKSMTVIGYSTTLPPHILSVVKKKAGLHHDHFHIHRTCNRPNIMYATHQIVGSLSDFRNLDLILPIECERPDQIPLTIVFHDSIQECSDAALFQDAKLPPGMPCKGLVRHYHSYMSARYLEETYQAFQDGICRILHTCSGMEAGVDFKRADIVTSSSIY
jgi:hypothetical protein